MGVFDEYINSLEGQENVDPVVVARSLHELHTQELTSELGTREAKIAQLNSAIAEKDSAITEREKLIEQHKAKNYDLLMESPGSSNHNDTNANQDEKPSGASIKVGDLFDSKVRIRHGL